MAWEGDAVEMRWIGDNGKWIQGVVKGEGEGEGWLSRKIRFQLLYLMDSGTLSIDRVSS